MAHDQYDLDSGGWQATLGGVDVEYAAGALARLGGCARDLGASRALLVTDRGLVEAGHAAAAESSLSAAGIAVAVFDGVEENPTTEHVEAARDHAQEAKADLLIGLGGGSAMDCAKGANFLLAGGGRMEDYWGYGKARGRLLPSIGVPTTAGTGSEAQSFALVARQDDHRKMACGDRQVRFRTVILDPCLLASLPQQVASVSALDAVSHAIESYVSKRRSPVSQMLGAEAWRLLERSFEGYLNDRCGGAAADMLIGAHLGGAAIEASMLGAAHACANPLTARFGTTHGIAVGLMLPPVVRFNAALPAVEALYQRLAPPSSGDDAPAAERLAQRLETMGRIAGIGDHLEALRQSIDTVGFDRLAEDAVDQWTGRFNPRTLDHRAALELYRAALEGAVTTTEIRALQVAAREVM